ncbi:PTS sugar transporter subunit IIA [Planctomycetota bacterium]
MKFADFLCFDAVIPELEATDRDDVIIELMTALDKCGKLGRGKRKELYKAVIKRENEASTGMGKGVAVPHVKHPRVKNIMVTVGQSSSGIDFSSLDKLPVYSVILMLSPVDDPDKHLQAMERIFKHLQNETFRKFLRQAQSAKAIEELFREADDNVFL